MPAQAPALSSRPYDLTGQRILLTGAAGGIGRATANLLANLGAELVLTDRAAAPDLLASLAGNGRVHSFVACDVTSPSEITALCGGVGAVDALILNAGIFPTSQWTDDPWDDDFDAAMRINVRASAHFARALLPAMKARGTGRIVMLGSVAAHTGGTYAHSPLHYAASKGAVHTMVRWMARRAAPEVLVNGIAPGSTATAMVATADPSALKALPVPRFGRPDEIAWPIAFLCSPGASFICGTTIDVNGGAYMR
ncbi:MAG: SDR family oxidoreductase [Phreatobacter sp.]|uniref:SDR family NAD(P)-dependent oxidoreductase n=1 Tax=Phreatobacter sp. TaxID=1966341 RepID=UPI001A40CEB3|nr:SDR family oxidoreductase [Phreatobacter sp.]MBL8570258.1 SDR family oxidoreductase [Phreatobacter sp.]